MDNMKEKILITSITVFPDKQTGEIKTRVGFILGDPKNFTTNRNFKGYQEGSSFYSGNLLDTIPNEAIMVPLYGTLVSKRSLRDPMKSYLTLKNVEFKGHVFSLLQD